jgi:predicted GNAT family acetyltransferase
MLTLERFREPLAFEAAAGPFLAAREAEHNLILGIVGTLRDHPGLYPEPPYLAVVRDGDRVVAAATRTPPLELVLSESDVPGAIDRLVEDVASRDPALVGVNGPRQVAASFAEGWTLATGRSARRAVEERIYRLERVVPPIGVRGSRRLAEPGDVNLLEAWWVAFHREALPEVPTLSEPRATAERWTRRVGRTAHLWVVDGRPVSLVATDSPTPNGIRIGPVYTPPDQRRRGYASALTAAASQAELDAGRRFCFLFTDLANPTSNHIYQAIGYEPVIDIDVYRFV